MDKGSVSIADIQTVPEGSLILLVGPPGAGKSTFCHQVVLNSIATDRPILFVTTEQGPTEITGLLQEQGLGELPPGALSFVDAFAETVGLATPERADTLGANCEDLNSISVALAKLQQRVGRKKILLAFDSLTSPYLFNREEILRFIRLCLLRFAAEGNSVVALMDEGCGRAEDLVAMMSVADGIITMEMGENARIVHVVKHPKVAPTTMETPMTTSTVLDLEEWDPKVVAGVTEWLYTQRPGEPMRTKVPDFVNQFWLNLAVWSGMLWDPRRFPAMAYESWKKLELTAVDLLSSVLPWHRRLLMKLFVPKSFSEVKDMRRFSSRFLGAGFEEVGNAIAEYVEEESGRDEHVFRLYESNTCWGFDHVGARLGHPICGGMAGWLQAFETEERDWNVVETECIGLGSPYCEFKAVPGEPDELRDFLLAIDSSAVEKVHDRLMDQLVGFLVRGEPLAERPRLGSGIWFIVLEDSTSIPALLSERYRMALRMGGAKVGKEVGEHLMAAGVMGDEAIKRVIDFMDYCQVGKITLRPGPSTLVGTGSGQAPGETIRMRENCETFGLNTGEPSCFFTTGFLNGLFSAVKNQHVREVKCIAAGDPYCEWEIIA
jgi:predicted hydrocarbon binding protein/KaiC/GvpD/RAD55 family RecA-like ATPase